MTSPSDRERRGKEDGEPSNLAKNMRMAERYTGAAFSLVASVGILSWLGYKLDQRWGHRVPWLLLVGAVIGMIGGFIGFFRTVLPRNKDK